MKGRKIGSGMVMALVTTLCLGAGVALAGTAATAPQEEMTIAGKKPARFSHPTHLQMGLDCAVCHHDGSHTPLTAEAIGALADTAQLKCVSCHNADHPDEKLRKAKDVFHARCRDCHKKGYEGKKGPTKCSGCHLKKKYEGC
ncbi:MAG: hypothetical protein Kow0089_18150 [Desulfobulbaceae bacterium]